MVASRLSPKKAAQVDWEESTSLVKDALAVEALRDWGSWNWEQLRRSNVESLYVEAWNQEEEECALKGQKGLIRHRVHPAII